MKCLTSLTLALAMLAAGPLAADSGAEPAAAEYQRMLEEAERVREEAESARHEARKIGEQARETARQQARLAREQAAGAQAEAEALQELQLRQQAELAAARDELGRAHRELREASREIAAAHRELARAGSGKQEIRVINLGERPVIGVVLGEQVSEGVEIIGVSPDGPADQAGIKTGDILLSLNGEKLASEDGAGRAAIFRIMDEAEPGEALELTVRRGQAQQDFTVVPERREPSSWQSIVRIPRLSSPHTVPGAEDIHIERIERIEIPEFEGDFEFEFEEFSDLAGHAMREANIWFGLPMAQGLELATIDPALGRYFETERGVLVIKAREDNDYQLQSGDVILHIADREVNTPGDVVRALREVEAGVEVAIEIKRDRRDVTLKATMPENRFGLR